MGWAENNHAFFDSRILTDDQIDRLAKLVGENIDERYGRVNAHDGCETNRILMLSYCRDQLVRPNECKGKPTNQAVNRIGEIGRI